MELKEAINLSEDISTTLIAVVVTVGLLSSIVRNAGAIKSNVKRWLNSKFDKETKEKIRILGEYNKYEDLVKNIVQTRRDDPRLSLLTRKAVENKTPEDIDNLVSYVKSIMTN